MENAKKLRNRMARSHRTKKPGAPFSGALSAPLFAASHASMLLRLWPAGNICGTPTSTVTTPAVQAPKVSTKTRKKAKHGIRATTIRRSSLKDSYGPGNTRQTNIEQNQTNNWTKVGPCPKLETKKGKTKRSTGWL